MESIWNYMNQKDRKELLTRAGYSTSFYPRVWSALPSWVREDLSYAHRLATA